jgi:hypothetical protein
MQAPAVSFDKRTKTAIGYTLWEMDDVLLLSLVVYVAVTDL